MIRSIPLVICLAVGAAACGGSDTGPSRQIAVSPTSPSASGPVTLTVPRPVTPVGDTQLGTLRPTLTVENATSTPQSGTRTYEFQIADRSDFSLGAASLVRGFLVTVSQTGVAEGSGGTTDFTPTQDLQPATKMYWRARVAQGSTTSDWSEIGTFRTKLVGFSRAGELYDPLIHAETIGTPIGSTSFVPGRGIRLNDELAYVRYPLAQTITSGEFSAEVEGLSGGAPGEKLKIFSMQHGTGNLLDSPYLMNVQYRGSSDANPNNSISFKVLYGSETRKFEPSKPFRTVVMLDGAKTYFWKATWGTGAFNLLVQDGVGGATIYDYGVPTTGTYSPAPHYAYLGANNRTFGGGEGGTRPGAVFRNVWIGSRPRPATLGNAID